MVLAKYLDIKGFTFNVNIDTVLTNIRLVVNSTKQIESKIEGQVIVILTNYPGKTKKILFK